MNDLNALLRAIITNPDDDTPRLMYADELDSLPTVPMRCTNGMCGGPKCKPGQVLVNHGRNYKYGEPRSVTCKRCQGTGTDPETMNGLRAELIRSQIEYANLGNRDPKTFYIADLDRMNALKRRVGYILNNFPNITGAIQKVTWQQIKNTRGFTSEVVTTAENFLKGADALVWHPEQMVRCGGCEKCKDGLIYTGMDGMKWIECRVPRPCPDTAQPIRTVTLTTPPHERDFGTTNRMIVGEAGTRIEYYRWPGVFFVPPPEPTG